MRVKDLTRLMEKWKLPLDSEVNKDIYIPLTIAMILSHYIDLLLSDGINNGQRRILGESLNRV